jgi:hypothetical protein
MAITPIWPIEGVALNSTGAMVANSLAYRVMDAQGEVEVIEQHFHSRERWFGKRNPQTATDWADNVINLAFHSISAANAYGTDVNDEALILGTADTPSIVVTNTRFDLHRIFVVAASTETVWKVQLIYGTGTMADAIAAGQFSTFMFKIDAAAASSPALPVDVMMPRGICGSTQVWARAWNATNNASIDFYVGVHEYAA